MKEKPSSPRDDSAHLIRHSKAEYFTYRAIKGSEHPERGFDPEDQITPDLSQAGREFAEEKAREFFARFDPRTDVFFFASSNEARALETADIYRRIAHELGFEVIKHKRTGTDLAKKIGEGEIRTIESLSLNSPNILLNTLFNPKDQVGTINWTNVDPETRRKWEQARVAIDAHDYGSFGANFFHHSKTVQAIFPEIKTAEDKFHTQFKNLLRLIEFAKRKVSSSGEAKNIRVVAFGHEDYLGHALNEYFQDHEIRNCEVIDVPLGEEGITLKRR